MIITGGLKAHAGVVGFAVQATARLYKGQEVDFVAARTNDHWLLKAVGGESAVKGHCRSSELLTQLKDKLTAKSEAKEEPPATADEDPMNKLKTVDVTPPPKRRRVMASAVKSRLVHKQEVGNQYGERLPLCRGSGRGRI